MAVSTLWALAKGAGIILGAYLTFLLGLITPELQRQLLFLHFIRWPLFAKFDRPEKYGLAPYKTRNYQVGTPDGERLGVWHVLPHLWYRANAATFPPERAFEEEAFEDALLARPTVIFFHGNAATRATGDRVRTYSALSTRLDCNVIAPDYRGFADSTGSPTEQRVLIDARAVWDDVVAKMARAHVRAGSDAKDDASKSIVIMGHSLGTGVSAGLVSSLQKDEIYPRALIMLAPFTSIPDLLSTYRLLTFIPVLGPLRIIPGLPEKVLKLFLRDRFDTRQALKSLRVPTLIGHTLDDLDIPSSHSAALFSSLLAPDESAVTSRHPSWGTLRKGQSENGSPLWWWEGLSGGHNGIIFDDGVIDLVADLTQL